MMKKIVVLLLICVLVLVGCGREKNPFLTEISEERVRPVSTVVKTSSENGEFYSNELFGWGLKKNVNAPPEVPESIQTFIAKYGGIYLDNKPKSLYLTFDEGYENGYTAKILDVLKENNVKAAFFVTGPYLEKETELVKRMFDEGHVVGNHTVNHPSLPGLSNDDEVKKEIEDLNTMCKEKYGQSMHFFRPPRGEYSERTLKISRDLGYTNVFWSFAYKDWEVKNQRGTDYAYEQIKKGVHDGAVLLLHAVSKDNAEVLDRVIKDLKSEGYRFKSLEDFGG